VLVAIGFRTRGFRLRQALPPPADASLPAWPVGSPVGPVPASPHGRAFSGLELRGNRFPAANPVATAARAAVSHLARQGVEGSVRAQSTVAEDCTSPAVTYTTARPSQSSWRSSVSRRSGVRGSTHISHRVGGSAERTHTHSRLSHAAIKTTYPPAPAGLLEQRT